MIVITILPKMVALKHHYKNVIPETLLQRHRQCNEMIAATEMIFAGVFGSVGIGTMCTSMGGVVVAAKRVGCVCHIKIVVEQALS